MALSLVFLLGLAHHAAAQMKEGEHPGSSSMSGDMGCQCLKQLKGLSDKEMEQVKSQKEAFQKVAEPIKQDLFEKRMELISVLAKQDVDVGKAKKLQSKISDLEKQLGLKKIDCLIRLKEISPKAGRFCLKKCFMMGPGMGGCKGAGFCPGKSGKGMGSCPGKKGLSSTDTN